MTPTVVVRGPEPHETDALIACSEAAYSLRYPASWRERIVERVEAGGFRCAFLEGELVGVLASYDVELTVPGPLPLEATGLSEVAVLPSFRRRGVLRALMADALDEATGRGKPLAVLFASEGGIYGRFGFGPACFAARYRLDRSRARLSATAPQPRGTVRLLGEADARSAFPAVFEEARRARPGEVDRSPSWWEAVFDEHKAAGRPPGARFFACYEERGRIDGYAIYHVANSIGVASEDRTLELIELVALDSAAYAGLWRYLVGVDLVSDLVTGGRPLDEPLRHLLDDPRALETTRVTDQLWLRLLDPAAALAARRYEQPGELVVEVTGGELAPTRYRVEVGEDGKAAVETTAGPAELRLDLAALGACYLGGTSLVPLALAGRVEELAEGALRRGAALLGRAELPFSAADF